MEENTTQENLTNDYKTVENNTKTHNRVQMKNKKKKSFASFLIKFTVIVFILLLFISSLSILLVYISRNNLISGLNLNNQFLRANVSQSSSNQNVSLGSLQFATNTESKTPATVVSENLPSVVSIRVKSNVGFNIGGESAGTGFFATEDGLIITNRHVISSICNAQTSSGRNFTTASYVITALTSQNKAYDLEVLSIDPTDDLAILRVKNLGDDKVRPVKFSDSKKLVLGSDVIAVGNVLGEFSNSVTKGIISGLNRTLQTELKDECTDKQVVGDGLIQTDAAINQGNSGGPLFDGAGNVIGVNTFGATQAQNIGFALPSETIIQAINSFKEFGKITKPQLGVVTRTLDSALKIQYPWLPSDYGELIYSPNSSPIIAGSGASKAGLNEGDIIIEINDQKIISDINGNSPFRRKLLENKPNSEITLTIIKSLGRNNQNGYNYETSPRKVTVKLGSIDFNLNSNLSNIR
jgi:S1-C subfamily serine protease